MKKKIRVIFLDIDGVLWTYPNEIRKKRKYDKLNSSYEKAVENAQEGKWNAKTQKILEEFDPTCCSNLNWLLEQVPEAVIVVSSTWRHGRSVKKLERILLKNGVHNAKGRVIDKTGQRGFSRHRGGEINMWLKDEENLEKYEVESYVILDDDSDMLDSQLENFVQTDTTNGLTLHDAARASFILGDRENVDMLTHREYMIKKLQSMGKNSPKLEKAIEEAIEAKRKEREEARKNSGIYSVIP